MADKLAEVTRRRQFEQAYAGHVKQLFRYVLNLTRDENQAEEIVHTAILSFIESMEKTHWEPEINNIQDYLKRVATNIYENMRKHPREEGLAVDAAEQSEQALDALTRQAIRDNDPTARLEDKIYYEELYKALPWAILGGMSEYEQNLLYLYAVDEMSPKEIAQVVGEDVDRARHQLYRILAKIRYRTRTYYSGQAVREKSVARERVEVSKPSSEGFEAPASRLESAIRECVDAVRQTHEQIQRNREEIDRLRGETQRLLAELKAA